MRVDWCGSLRVIWRQHNVAMSQPFSFEQLWWLIIVQSLMRIVQGTLRCRYNTSWWDIRVLNTGECLCEPSIWPFRTHFLNYNHFTSLDTVMVKLVELWLSHWTIFISIYFQFSTTSLPLHAVVSIWVISYFELLRDDLLCTNSTFVKNLLSARKRSLLSTDYRLQNGDRIGKDKLQRVKMMYRELFELLQVLLFKAENQVKTLLE